MEEAVIEKIQFGEELIDSLEQYKNIQGVQKLARKINQELTFLRKILKLHVAKVSSIKKEHLQCSNLTHFSALIAALGNVTNCKSVNKVFMLDDRKITIDIVYDDGLTWKKVIARNPKSVAQVCMGDTSYGVRSVVDQAEDYIECAKLYPHLYKIPKVVFFFAHGVDAEVARKIQSFGIVVEGERMGNCSSEETISDEILPTSDQCFNDDLTTPNISTIDKVNLDVSAMLAYVSSVTNGSAFMYEFPVKVLAQQAEWERQRPVKPILDAFFTGKQLYCCETAKNSFLEIVKTVGGSNEKIRADELLKKLIVLSDDGENDFDCKYNVQFGPDKCLNLGGKIRERSLKIFRFGDRIGAVTVTSNHGFVRSARQQGINFVVFIHESRALTEQKEILKGIPNETIL